MSTDEVLQQGAEGEEYPPWFSAYLRSLTGKKEEVKAAELDEVLQSYDDVSQVFRSNISAAYRAETKLEAAKSLRYWANHFKDFDEKSRGLRSSERREQIFPCSGLMRDHGNSGYGAT